MRILKIFFILGLLFSGTFSLQAQSAAALVDMCAMGAGDDATYLKDYIVELEAAQPNERPPVEKVTILLKKNTQYRLSVCNSETSQGKAVIQLYDEGKLLGSTYNAETGRDFDGFDFTCTKTGPYHIFLSFQDGKSGSAVCILSFIKIL
ncbi:MAG: hypothetical protein ACOCXW_00385 [Bacteroidota bacterium]